MELVSECRSVVKFRLAIALVYAVVGRCLITEAVASEWRQTVSDGWSLWSADSPGREQSSLRIPRRTELAVRIAGVFWYVLVFDLLLSGSLGHNRVARLLVNVGAWVDVIVQTISETLHLFQPTFIGTVVR